VGCGVFLTCSGRGRSFVSRPGAMVILVAEDTCTSSGYTCCVSAVGYWFGNPRLPVGVQANIHVIE